MTNQSILQTLTPDYFLTTELAEPLSPDSAESTWSSEMKEYFFPTRSLGPPGLAGNQVRESSQQFNLSLYLKASKAPFGQHENWVYLLTYNISTLFSQRK